MSDVGLRGRAGRLVVEPGDRVGATGDFVRFPDADWLDVAHVSDLVLRRGPWKSDRSLRLVGADVSATAALGGNDEPFVPRRVRVTGRWDGDVLGVEAHEPVPWPAHRPQKSLSDTLENHPVEGGWDTRSDHAPGLAQLEANGQIVRHTWCRVGGRGLVLCVAAADVAAVHRVLDAQLPRRLFVVPSRYSVAAVRELDDMIGAHAREWGFETWSRAGLDADCQPHAEAHLTRVSADLAAWADTLPGGLLTLHPAITPAEV